MNDGKKVRFIRVRGRVIPIRVSVSDKSIKKVKTEAVDAARQMYQNKVADDRRQVVSAVFGVAKTIAGLGSGAAVGKYALEQGSKLSDAYVHKAETAQRKYRLIGGAGLGIGAAGAAVLSKASSFAVLKRPTAFGIGASIVGAGAAAIGAYGSHKASQHVKRARVIQGAFGKIKMFTGNE